MRNLVRSKLHITYTLTDDATIANTEVTVDYLKQNTHFITNSVVKF